MRKPININETLFLIAWVMFSSTLILMSAIIYVNNPEMEMALKLIRYISYTICIIKVIREQYSLRLLLLFVLLVLVFAISGLGTRNLTYPLYCFIVLASVDIDNERIVKITAGLQLFFLITIIFLSQTGLIMDFVFEPEGRARHGLGFSWTTTAPILFFYYILCSAYIERQRITFVKLTMLELICIWLLYMTDSKMAFGLSTLFIIFIAVEKLNKHRWKWISRFRGVYIVFPFIMLFVTFVVVKVYNWYNPTWAFIDRTMSYRLGLAQNAFNKYGVHLLGQPIKWVGYDYKATLLGATDAYNYVDSSYLQLAFNNGLVFLAAVLIIYACAIYKSVKSNDYYLVVIYIAVLTFSLTEPRLMNFAYNPFPLLAFGRMSIIENNKNKKRNRSVVLLDSAGNGLK